ncbi:hypothetical protein ID0090_05940 [Helicobacter pylori]
MAYRYDSDLEFLKQLSSSDLKDLFDVLVYDEDDQKRANIPKGSLRSCSVMEAIVLRASLKAKESYIKKFCAMCAII